MTKISSQPKLELPEMLRRVLPAARWKLVESNNIKDPIQVWGSQRYWVKVRVLGQGHTQTLQQERERLRWLTERIPVATLVGHEVTDTHEYLATFRLRGIALSHSDALLHPKRLVSLLARALREIHAIPIRDCPFDMSLRQRLTRLRDVVEAKPLDETITLFNELARQRLSTEDLVVTHGQATLLAFVVHGEWLEGVSHVGHLGLADRHVDIASAYDSVLKYLDQESAEQFLDEYGRELVQPEHLEYYQKLDALEQKLDMTL